MSDKNTEKDQVIAMLQESVSNTEILENDSLAEVYKYMLYANPKGSGMINLTDKKRIKDDIATMFSDVCNSQLRSSSDITFAVLPTANVGIHIRMRHTISEFLKKYEIVAFMQAHIYHRNAKGEEGKLRYQIGDVEKVVGPLQLESMKASIKTSLVEHLPAVVDDCYRVKYGSASNFTYSLVDVKKIRIEGSFLNASFDFIERATKDINFSQDSLIKNSENWYKYCKNSKSGISKYGDHLLKLLKVLCARAGKFKFMKQFKPEDAKQGESPTELRNRLVQYKGLIEQIDNLYIPEYKRQLIEGGENGQQYSVQLDKGEHQVISDTEMKEDKKYYQNILFKSLLSHVRKIAYHSYREGVPNDFGVFLKSEYSNVFCQHLDVFINTCGQYLVALDTNVSVVFLDSYSGKYGANLNTCIEFLRRSQHSANARVLNSLYKFFSVSSLFEDAQYKRAVLSSRKRLPEEVDRVLAHELRSDRNAERLSQYSSRRRLNDPSLLLFSFERTDNMTLEEVERLRLSSGYLQKAVMIIKAIISSGPVPDNESINNEYNYYANCLDHWADCYEQYCSYTIEPYRKELEKSLKKSTNSSSGFAMIGGGVASGAVSPLANVSVFGPFGGQSTLPVGGQSTPTGNGSSVSAFDRPSQVPVGGFGVPSPQGNVSGFDGPSQVPVGGFIDFPGSSQTSPTDGQVHRSPQASASASGFGGGLASGHSFNQPSVFLPPGSPPGSPGGSPFSFNALSEVPNNQQGF